jgi:Nuclease-related domain
MGNLVQHALLVAGVIALMFTGPALGMWFLVRRKAKDRARRRSPLSSELLRAPGESLVDQINELDSEILAWVVMLMVLPLLVVCVHLAQSYLLREPESLFRWVFAVALVGACIGTGVHKLHGIAARKDNMRLGLDGERSVAEELNQLMRKGAFVFHDVPGEEFNIDHLVIAREGVFAVETKGYSKPVNTDGRVEARVQFDGARLHFPMFRTSKPLEQAERQAKWVSQWLSKSTGSPVIAIPVLALPGWFVEHAASGPVRVYSGKQLHQLLNVRGTVRLSDERVQSIAYQAEQRCRTVLRAFAPLDEKAT